MWVDAPIWVALTEGGGRVEKRLVSRAFRRSRGSTDCAIQACVTWPRACAAVDVGDGIKQRK